MENLLQKLLGKQFLITAYIEKKLQIVNYIKNGYDANLPILINNKFLHFTAQVHYRSIIIDLHSLFGKANSSNKNSFFFIEKNCKSLIKPGSIEVANKWIEDLQEEISIIKDLRHKQMAHYDFTQKEMISLNFHNLLQVNNLFALSKKIILHYGNSFVDEKLSIGYDFEREHHDLNSLKRLIAKAARS